MFQNVIVIGMLINFCFSSDLEEIKLASETSIQFENSKPELAVQLQRQEIECVEIPEDKVEKNSNFIAKSTYESSAFEEAIPERQLSNIDISNEKNIRNFD